MQEMINKVDMIDMRKMVDMIDMRKMLDRLDEKVILIVQVTHSIYAAFANFSAALQLLFILDFRLVLMSIFTLHLFIIASMIPFIIKFSTAMSAALKTRG